MEYCSGGDLTDSIVKEAKLNERDISRVIYKVISAVNYLHTINIAHRDIKPDNILLVDKED